MPYTTVRHLDLFFKALAVQGLVANLRWWAPHSESNYPSLLISNTYVEALGELDQTLVPDLACFFPIFRYKAANAKTIQVYLINFCVQTKLRSKFEEDKTGQIRINQ